MRLRGVAAFVLALSLSPMAWAAQPKASVVGPVTRKSGQSVLLDARASVSDRPLQWKLVSPPGAPLLTFDQDGRRGVFAFLPDPDDGAYTVALVAVGEVDNSLEADVAVVQIIVGGHGPRPPPGPTPEPTPDPTPPPGPTPDPTPPPVPVSEAVHATLVFDFDQARVGIAAIRTDRAIREAADRFKVHWRSYDDDSKAVRDRNLLPFVQQAGGVPALIVQASDGRVIASLPCPPTPEGVVEVFEGLRKTGMGGAR